MKIIRLTYLFLTIVIMTACGPTSGQANVNEGLKDADDAMIGGNYRLAAQICDGLFESTDTTVMTWRDYCRMAVVYAVAYDHDIEAEKSMVSATKCVSRARALQPDSTDEYLSSVSNDYIGAMQTVVRTLDGVTADKSDIADHEYTDGEDEDNANHTHNQ